MTTPNPFTERQREVIRLIAEGLSQTEMAERMGCTPRTVKAHCELLRLRLNVPLTRQIPTGYMKLTGDDPYPRPS